MNKLNDLQRVKKTVDWLIFEGKARNNKDLADKLGYTESSFSQILNGKVSLSERFINKLSIFSENINKDWLLGKSNKMLINTNQNIMGDTTTPDALEAPKEVGTETIIELSTKLGEQINENKHLHRTNMELSAKIEALKKEIEELKSREADFEEQIQGLKKQIHAYRTTSEPLSLGAEPEPAPLIKKSDKKPPNYPKNPGGKHYFGAKTD